MIYLDNAATTYPKPKEVYDYLDTLNRDFSFNAGRGSYKKAQDVAQLIEKSRDMISKVVNADSTIFSSSATFAINQIISGLELNKYSNVYYSPYEHNAVMRTLYKKSKEIGFNMFEIPLNNETLAIDLDKLNYMYTKNKPSVVFCIHVSNVTGYVSPIKEIGELSEQYKAIFIVDGAQSFALLPIDMVDMKIDFVVFAGHKTLYGPFGVGGYCIRSNYKLNPYYYGGTGSDSLNLDMPMDGILRFEPSSHNSVGIISLIKSVEWLKQNVSLIEREKELYSFLVDNLKKIPGVFLYHNKNNEYFGTVSFNLEGFSSTDVGEILDNDFDIAVRSGYHCAPLIHEYLKDKANLGTIRVSIGLFSSKSDINSLISAIKELLEDN